MRTQTPKSSARGKLLDAALVVIRRKGYAAAAVDDLCREAGVTKGAFFHHFPNKEALAVAAAKHFADMADGLFTAAPYATLADPLDRLLGYVDFRIEILQGPVFAFTCLLGTLVQELHETHPAVRAAVERHLFEHVAMLERDVAAAKALHAPDAPFTPRGVAVHMQTVLQGSLIFAKATGGPAVAVESLSHLHRYLQLLFQPQRTDSHV